MNRFAVFIPLGLLASGLSAQSLGEFPSLQNAGIPGAPSLTSPQLIMGKTKPVEGRFHGLAAPGVFDWDKDGKKDLLVGEFETGECYLRVYQNQGTNDAPRFTDEFVYAETYRGERLKIASW